MPQKKFFPSWPPSIIWVHSCNRHGARPLGIPDMLYQGARVHDLWAILALVSNVAEIYEAVFQGTSNEDYINGWLLKHIHEIINPNVSQRTCDRNNSVAPPYQWQNLYIFCKLEGSHKRERALWKMMRQTVEDGDDAFSNTLDNVCEEGIVEQFEIENNGNRVVLTNIDVPDNCEIIVVNRPPDVESSWFCDNLRVNKNKFKARFIYDDVDAQDAEDPCKCRVYVRHREEDYDKWWCLERNSIFENRQQMPYKVDALPTSVQCYTWTKIVYVRMKDEMQRVVKQCYESMGGNMNVVCRVHKNPLFASANGTKLICSFVRGCKRRSKFECTQNCTAHICRDHLKEALEEAGMGLVTVPPIPDVDIKVESGSDSSRGEDGDMKVESRSDSSSSDISSDISSMVEIKIEPASNTDHAARRGVAAEDMDSSTDNQFNEAAAAAMDSSSDESDIDNEYDPFLFVADKALEINDDVSLSDMFMTEGNTNVPSHDPIAEYNVDGGLKVPTTEAALPNRTRQVFLYNGRRISCHICYNISGQCLQRTNNQLSATQYERGFLQGIISPTNDAIPLIYIEGAMFPDIFWKSNKDGSIVGSLTAPLLTDEAQTRLVNIASFKSHSICRMCNSSIGTSANARYIFMVFDILQNILLRGTDDRTILHRGLREQHPGLQVMNQGSAHSNVHSCDAIDSRHAVNCLAAQLRDCFPTYFITLTCNTKEFPSMRSLYNIKTAFICACNESPTMPLNVKKEITRSIEALAAVQLTRTWQVCIETMMKFITESPDEVMGKFIGHFARLEHQESEFKASGTNSHLHLIGFVETDPNSEEDKKEIYHRVRGSSDTLFLQEDISDLIKKGIIADAEEGEKLRQFSRILQVHDCRRCKYRCLRTLPNGDTVCKYPDYAVENPRKIYGFVLINMKHSEAATAILVELDFLEKLEDGSIRAKDARFQAGKHVYPADRGEHFSPTNPFLFGLTRSDCNVIVCGRYMVSRYLAKYVASIDEVSSPESYCWRTHALISACCVFVNAFNIFALSSGDKSRHTMQTRIPW